MKFLFLNERNFIEDIIKLHRKKMNSVIFKAYDIRGIYPSDINPELAYRIGQAYVKAIQPGGKVAVGMDVRIHSPQIKEALISGLINAGIDVIDIGLTSTEMLYFTVGYYNLSGGIQVTASHNPAEWNGMKIVGKNVVPIFSENGLLVVRDLIINNNERIKIDIKGKVEFRDVLEDFAKFVLKFIDSQSIQKTDLVFNPNFGFGGEVLKAVRKIGDLPLSLKGLNDKPDGAFPKGRPDPLIPENRLEFIELVKSSKADLGVSWDADADRVFFCSGQGVFVEPYFTSAVLADYLLNKEPGEAIVYDSRCTWALIDIAKKYGSQAILSRVGHSFIKAKMREKNAIFAGESSGHIYFRDFWYADSGIIPLLLVLEMLSQKNQILDEILEPLWNKYFISGEINNRVENPDLVIDKIKGKYFDGELSFVDGLSVEYGRDWRANIRVSVTEGLLRLNVEAKSKELMEEKRGEILDIINQYKEYLK